MYYAFVFDDNIIGYGESKEDALKNGQRAFKPHYDEHTLESIESKDPRFWGGPLFAEMSEQLYYEIQKEDYIGNYATYRNVLGLLRAQTCDEEIPCAFMDMGLPEVPKAPAKRKGGCTALAHRISPYVHAYILELRHEGLTYRKIAEKLQDNIYFSEPVILTPTQIRTIAKTPPLHFHLEP